MHIRPLLISLCLSILATSAIAQDRYLVKFTDRNGSPFSLSNPLQFLSQRALDRRTNQNIILTDNDLPVNPSYVQGVAATGASVLNQTKWFNGVIIQTSDPNVLAAISQLPYVQSTLSVGLKQPSTSASDKFQASQPVTVLPETNYANRSQSGIDYGFGANQVNMLGLEYLHNQGYRGQNLIIAVLDAGFSNADTVFLFDSLYNRNGVIATWDFVAGDNQVYDDHWHGTSVLSCMAANNPGILVGTAPYAKYLLLRSEDANTEYVIEEYNWSCAAEYADSAGADVINTSLGYTTFDDWSQNHTNADMNGNTCPASIAADIAASKGILVVASAGNEGNSLWNNIGTPADGDSVLAVGAVDSTGMYASFSSKGPSADGRIKPDVAAQGARAWLYNTFSHDVGNGNGTSFSGPIIAGAATCLWQAWPGKSNMEILHAIQKSASIFSNPDSLIGYGIPNFALADNLLSLDEYNLTDDVRLHIFPNPWNGIDELHAFFYADDSEKIDVSVIDILGQEVSKESTFVTGGLYNSLPMKAPQASGIYFLRVQSKKGQFSATWMKR